MCEASVQKQYEGCADLHGADVDFDHNLPVAKICNRLKTIIMFQKETPRGDLKMLYAQQQKVHDTLEEKLNAIECESRNVESTRKPRSQNLKR
jgi:hypothetical protein